MTEAELKHNRQRLLALKRRLGSELSDLEEEALRPVGGEAAGGLSNVPVHPSDLGNETYEEEVNLSLVENEAQLLGEVNDALQRVEASTYGRCEHCGQEIDHERLEAVPWTRYCLQCARQLQGQIRS